MDAKKFLIMIRCIQKRTAETTLMKAHLTTFLNADKDMWNNFRISLGFEPELSDIEKAAKMGQETNLEQLADLRALVADK